MKKLISIFLALAFLLSSSISTYAHSGRTDSSGGHRDNKNRSGLGSYHYHCGGNPAHLHRDGVCPYRQSNTPNTSSESTSSSSSSSVQNNPSNSNSTSNSATPPTISTPTLQPTLNNSERAIASRALDVINQATSSSNATATLTLTDENELTLATMQSIASSASTQNITVKINCDVLENGSVAFRLSVNPSLATKTINLGGSVDNANTQSIKDRFESWYNNKVEVIALSQTDDYGMTVSVIAKLDLSMLDANSLYVYGYNQQDNIATLVSSENYYIDANGYLHIKTSLGGYIIITDKRLILK